MKQLILMNKETGEIGLGCRVQFFDNIASENEIAILEGYSMIMRTADFDGWIVFSGQNDSDHPWLWMNKEMVDLKAEVIGEL